MVRRIDNYKGLNKKHEQVATKARDKALRGLCESMGVNPILGEVFLSEIKLDWENERDWLKQRVKLLGLW